jgi:outer membrane protein TolC
MKEKILFLTFLFAYQGLYAQKIDYNTIILPENARNLSAEERLVQLAWQNNPENKILLNNVEIAQHEVNYSATEWLNQIRVTGNLNESVLNNLNDADDDLNIDRFYPMYNISASIPLGVFITQPQKTKMARLQKENQEQAINNQKLQIRAMVLRNYQDFLLFKELLANQTEVTENAYNTYALIEEKFKNGESTLEEFNRSYNNYKTELANKMKASHQYEIAKINLEQLVGVKLEYLTFISL